MAVTKWFLKVSKCYPLDAKLANESVVEVANYQRPPIFNIIYMGIILLKICPNIA